MLASVSEYLMEVKVSPLIYRTWIGLFPVCKLYDGNMPNQQSGPRE